jgi:hypothetical protein
MPNEYMGGMLCAPSPAVLSAPPGDARDTHALQCCARLGVGSATVVPVAGDCWLLPVPVTRGSGYCFRLASSRYRVV